MVRAMPGPSSPRRAKRRAIIIGGSMSGLFTAAFLRQIGWDADVYERSSVELVGRGAGITGHPELWKRWKRAAQAPRISASRCPSVSPSIAMAASLTSARCGKSSPHGIACSACCAQPSTRRAITSAGISNASTRMSAAYACNFRGGRVEHADILVGGDGIRSSVRAQLAPQVQPIYAGYYIWRGAPNEADLAPETLEQHLSTVHVLLAQASAGDHLPDCRIR